jgi:hypothetical protein
MIPSIVDRVFQMSVNSVQEVTAPIATKAGAISVILSGAFAWINQNVGVFSSLALVLGSIVGVIGLYFQVKNSIASRRQLETQQKLAEDTIQRERELHELRIKALKKQVDNE